MSSLSEFGRKQQIFKVDFKLPQSVSVPQKKNSQRLRSWELSAMYHCSIIGTCLTASELRQFVIKLGDASARTESDHFLHGRGVRIAGQRDVEGKLLNKALDRRHETIVKRFSKASDAAGLRALWRDSYDRGEISGAYWAILTHPASDQALVRDVFGDVHMLSHLVGSSSRLDIARLNALQTECDRQTEKIDRQETRLMMHALKQREMQRRIDELGASLIVAQASRAGNDSESSFAPEGRLAVETVHTKELTARLRETEIALERAEACARQHEGRAAELQMEIERLDAMFSEVEGEPPVDHPAENLGATILYVGGRKNLFNRMRGLAERCGLALLIHDGGVEDSTSLLPAMIGQAEAVIFPVDHISHTAAGVLKRVCRDNGTPYVPLRSASLTSFAASIGGPLAKQISDSRQLRIGAALATTS